MAASHRGGPGRLARHAWPLLAALAFAPGAAALDSDRRQPIDLKADRAELDNAAGVSVYTGDVVLTQGTLTLTGDVMRVYTGDDRRVDRIEVDGTPATYSQLPEGETEYVDAEAPRMEYYARDPERIRLLQGAVLTQGRDRFAAQTIVYDVEADQVTADGDQGQRIHITIYPENDDERSESRP